MGVSITLRRSVCKNIYVYIYMCVCKSEMHLKLYVRAIKYDECNHSQRPFYIHVNIYICMYVCVQISAATTTTDCSQILGFASFDTVVSSNYCVVTQVKFHSKPLTKDEFPMACKHIYIHIYMNIYTRLNIQDLCLHQINVCYAHLSVES